MNNKKTKLLNAFINYYAAGHIEIIYILHRKKFKTGKFTNFFILIQCAIIIRIRFQL